MQKLTLSFLVTTTLITTTWAATQEEITQLKSRLESVLGELETVKKGSDDAWVLFAGIIIFFMQTGFALLESGTVRFKNYQNIFFKNCITTSIGAVAWYTIGFAAAFGSENPGGFIGLQKYFFCIGFSRLEFWFFHFAFACTASTIVSGSISERTQIWVYVVFAALVTGFIYPVVVAWTWGEGWLHQMGFKDFAGSGVVHLTGGIAGLVGSAIVGPRLGKFKSIRDDGEEVFSGE